MALDADLVNTLRNGGPGGPGAPGGGTWTVRELTRLVDAVADQPVLWKDEVLCREGSRWFTRLHLDGDVELWLMTWAQDSTTEMHDHGGSVGAYRVLEGTLTEDWADHGTVRRRRWTAGQTMAFGADRIHDVTNHDEAHAVSLHAYSPPLTQLTYYAADADGVRPVRTADVSNRVPS